MNRTKSHIEEKMFWGGHRVSMTCSVPLGDSSHNEQNEHHNRAENYESNNLFQKIFFSEARLHHSL